MPSQRAVLNSSSHEKGENIYIQLKGGGGAKAHRFHVLVVEGLGRRREGVDHS